MQINSEQMEVLFQHCRWNPPYIQKRTGTDRADWYDICIVIDGAYSDFTEAQQMVAYWRSIWAEALGMVHDG